jgi:hypothetical protein
VTRVFEPGDRVTVNPQLVGEWQYADYKPLIGRWGTVIAAENGRVDVIFDKTHRNSAQTIICFTKPDCLVREGESRPASLSLPDGSAFGSTGRPLPKDHWLFQRARNGEIPAPPMPIRMGTGPARDAMEVGIADAVRWAFKIVTRNGQDMGTDPDALVRNVILGLLGYETPDGLSRGDRNPDPVPPEFRP